MTNCVVIIVIHLKLLKFKYVNNYMLIYVKILKSSNCLDILHVDAYMPALHILHISAISSKLCILDQNIEFQNLVNKPHPMNRRTLCATRPTYTQSYKIISVFISCFLCMILLTFSLMDLYLVNCSKCSIFLRFIQNV